MTDNAVTVSQGGALVPATLGEAFRLAELMASAKLVPAALQKSPADCLLVIQQAVRWQMDPFAVAQECSVISGKLMHSGKLTLAVINARGNLQRRLSFTYAGEGDNRSITISGLLAGETTARTIDVKIRDARTTNQMWTKQPDQQLAYFGARAWARRHTPELMLGVYAPEEFDMIDVTPDPLPSAVVADTPAAGADNAGRADVPSQSIAGAKKAAFWAGGTLYIKDVGKLLVAISECPSEALLTKLWADNRTLAEVNMTVKAAFTEKGNAFGGKDHVGAEFDLPPTHDAETGEVRDGVPE